VLRDIANALAVNVNLTGVSQAGKVPRAIEHFLRK
jgi:hypothetical protein